MRNRRETSAAQEAVRHLIDLRAALEEQPLNTGPDLSIESIEAEILAATEAVAAGGRQADFLELDCSEAPCVAVVVVDQPTNDRTNPAILLEQELAADGRYLSSTASITKNGRIMVALGLWDGDVDDVAERRLRQRQSKAVQRTSPRATP